MRYLILLILTFGLIFPGCSQKNESKKAVDVNTYNSKSTNYSTNKEEIQKLIRQVLNWADSQKSLDLLPSITDSTNTTYIGIDLSIHQSNLKKLEKTNLFAKEFIDNYNHIILTLDKNLKNKVYSDWVVGDLQPFGFANDVNPWCYCQEIPSDNPNPWDLVETTIISLDDKKGELTWTWGKTDWRDIKYRFRVTKEDGKWTISYMKGFDYSESIKEY